MVVVSSPGPQPLFIFADLPDVIIAYSSNSNVMIFHPSIRRSIFWLVPIAQTA